MRALLYREFIRLSRQKGRLFGAFLTPLMIWFFLGLGFEDSFVLNNNSDINYFEYFFPGMILMTLMFSAIFSMISFIEDRNSGFLQSVWVSPVASVSIVLAKILSCSIFAFVQSLILLLCAFFFKLNFSFSNFLEISFILFLSSMLMSSIGFLLAWFSDSTQTFHVWMNIILMPMWLFSGALFTFDKVPMWMTFLYKVNPLSYSLAAMRWSMSIGQPLNMNIPSLGISNLLVMILTVVFVSAGVFVLNQKRN
ncbi:MAG TPA: ABC transporter permease [Oligoflexia bacterium]|nr:ABC transporter permease [Oligoflexia bacterium]HMR24013.1 ABC transporter permease [Oligoflexia bacterium]